MLAISAATIFYCTIQSNAKKFKYPNIDCSKIKEQYEGEEDRWRSDAGNEFIVNKQKEDQGEKTFFLGAMQCYCNDLAD